MQEIFLLRNCLVSSFLLLKSKLKILMFRCKKLVHLNVYIRVKEEKKYQGFNLNSIVKNLFIHRQTIPLPTLAEMSVKFQVEFSRRGHFSKGNLKSPS